MTKKETTEKETQEQRMWAERDREKENVHLVVDNALLVLDKYNTLLDMVRDGKVYDKLPRIVMTREALDREVSKNAHKE